MISSVKKPFSLEIRINATIDGARVSTNFRIPDRELAKIRRLDGGVISMHVVTAARNKYVQLWFPTGKTWLDYRQDIRRILIEANANALTEGGYDVDVHEDVNLSSWTSLVAPRPKRRHGVYPGLRSVTAS